MGHWLVHSRCLPSIVFLAIAISQSSEAEQRELSGLTVHRNCVYFVDDEIPGTVLSASINLPKAGQTKVAHCVTGQLRRVPFGTGIDLESIARLADGRYVTLSERTHCLHGRSGVIAEYPQEYSEIGNRGLEGLAVRKAENGVSRVAVCFEGGPLEVSDVMPELRAALATAAPRPIVLEHSIGRGESLGEVTDLTKWTIAASPPTRGYFFRMPDLVWYQFRDGSWGFLAILSAVNPRAAKNAERYKYRWLVKLKKNRRQQTLEPVGEPFDLDRIAGDKFQAANWEGLTWVDRHRVALCFDGSTGNSAIILVLDVRNGKETSR